MSCNYLQHCKKSCPPAKICYNKKEQTCPPQNVNVIVNPSIITGPAGPAGAPGASGTTGPTGPQNVSIFGHAVFETPIQSLSPNGERTVPIAFLDDPTSDKLYCRLPFENVIASTVGFSASNTTIPADNVAFPGFGYPQAPINNGLVLNYTFTRFNFEPGFWRIAWYVNLEFMIFNAATIGSAMNYYQLAIAEQIGTNLPTILNHTIRKAYGIPSFGNTVSTQGFCSGESVIRVTDPTLNYYIVFFKGPVTDNGVISYSKLQFEPIRHLDALYQQTSITCMKLTELNATNLVVAPAIRIV